mmetsp:Transcript_8275/g.1090  ORF Transcript_8275/g.1090 Transcript_8275/m.1090 type:complete len:85 (-) Transcript_8275:185-439(-)
MQWAIKIIKKVFKGYHIRKKFWGLINQQLSHNRFMFYSYAAISIQRMYRGYYSRKYVHDFYARKKYIRYIEEKNEKRLFKLRNH